MTRQYSIMVSEPKPHCMRISFINENGHHEGCIEGLCQFIGHKVYSLVADGVQLLDENSLCDLKIVEPDGKYMTISRDNESKQYNINSFDTKDILQSFTTCSSVEMFRIVAQHLLTGAVLEENE